MSPNSTRHLAYGRPVRAIQPNRDRERCTLPMGVSTFLQICIIHVEGAVSESYPCQARSSPSGCRPVMPPLRYNRDTRVLKSSDEMNLSLIDAFGRFGATPSNRVRSLSAIATDGAVVLNCSQQQFAHPFPGVLRYEDRLSREAQDSKDAVLLGQHLTLARDGSLPVRMIVAFSSDLKRGASRGYHVRPDLIGRVVKFDGEHFMIDFTRPDV